MRLILQVCTVVKLCDMLEKQMEKLGEMPVFPGIRSFNWIHIDILVLFRYNNKSAAEIAALPEQWQTENFRD